MRMNVELSMLDLDARSLIMDEDRRTAALEERIEELEVQLEDLHHQLRRAELDQWQGRVDDVELQVHLASMDVREQLAPLMEALRNRWLDAREQLEINSETASDAVDALRSGLEQALRDIRDAVMQAKSTITSGAANG
jgi:hypothetical protein